MGVDDRGNVGSHPQNFGMDEDLAVARHGAADPLALAIDGDDVVRRHLLEADAGGLHQKAPVAPGQAGGDMSGDIVALVLAHEHAARIDELFPQSIFGQGSPPVVAVCHRSYIASQAGATTRRSWTSDPRDPSSHAPSPRSSRRARRTRVGAGRSTVAAPIASMSRGSARSVSCCWGS